MWERLAAILDAIGDHHIADRIERLALTDEDRRRDDEQVPPEEPIDDQMISTGEPPLYDPSAPKARPLRIVMRPPKNPTRRIKNIA